MCVCLARTSKEMHMKRDVSVCPVRASYVGIQGCCGGSANSYLGEMLGSTPQTWLNGLACSHVSCLTLSGMPKILLYCMEYKQPTTELFEYVNSSILWILICIIWMFIDSLSYTFSVSVKCWLIIVFVNNEFIYYMNSFITWICMIHKFIYIIVHWVDIRNDFRDNHWHRLNIGKLKYLPKTGENSHSYVDHVPPRNVKSALALVVRLLLEHAKVPEDKSVTEDSAMKIIKNTSKDDIFIPIHSTSQHYFCLLCCWFFVHVIIVWFICWNQCKCFTRSMGWQESVNQFGFILCGRVFYGTLPKTIFVVYTSKVP